MKSSVAVCWSLVLAASAMVACAAETSTISNEPIAREDSALRARLGKKTRFFAPDPNPGATSQIKELRRAKRFADAREVTQLAQTPRAVWLVGNTPSEVKRQVRDTIADAHCKNELPVFVAYNIPFRDCAQYSSGGAATSADYRAWIDAVAEGLGKNDALLVLEPDSLGIIPYNTSIYGQEEWCKPTVTDADGNVSAAPGANPEERYALLNYAVDKLATRAKNTSVYLDSSHSAWLGVGEAAYRLARAGVARTSGFFLNVSNYEPTEQLTLYGTWVSSCLAAGTSGADWARGHFESCPSQYNPAAGYAVDYSPEYAASVSTAFHDMLGDAKPTTHFVLDTGRNGQGHWTPTASYPDAQVWCNPPARGVGLRPSADTGNALLDAYLWLKVPGESDGSCNRGIAGSTTDPEWGSIVDPAAGAWFPEQALQLAKLAVPKL
jgi:endoglucanase